METSTVAPAPGVAMFCRPRLAAYFGVLLVAALSGWLYLDIVRDLVTEWWTVPSSSYGFLIPPLAMYVAYLKRRSILAAAPERDLRGLGLVAAACGLLITGTLAAEFFLSRISIPILLAGLIWTFYGSARLRALAFPLLLLVTMVPLPAIVYNSLAAPLQLFASQVATSLAQAAGVSIYCEGNIIHLASTTLGVAEACSGLQSLSALMIGSLLLGFAETASPLGRGLIFVFSIPLAIFMNVLRIAGTAILADYSPQFAMGFYHMFSGWLVFVAGFLSLWLVAKGIFLWTRRRT